jgi:uncharacterized RDD family membrane protein YckC
MVGPNPYEPPRADVDSGQDAGEREELPLAGLGARLLNFIIDSIARILLAAIVAVAVGPDRTHNELPILSSFLGVVVGYYVVLEYLFGRTLGKLITGTRVVTAEDGRPSLLQILGRTLVRFIPLEPFSLLFSGGRVGGWHDWMSGTCVVRVRR